MLSILNHCCTIGDIPCVRLELHERSDWRALAPDTIGHSLIQHCVCILQAIHTSLFCMQLHTTTKLTYLMTAYYMPNDGFTANNALFYDNKVGSQCVIQRGGRTGISPPPKES